MKRMVTVTRAYGSAKATFWRLPPIVLGEPVELDLTDEQAWSLGRKRGILVDPMPATDPRPWQSRALTHAEVAELAAAKAAGPGALAELLERKNAALLPQEPEPEPPARKAATKRRGGDR